MNVLPTLQVEVEISQTTTLPLAALGICSPRFANPSEPRNHTSAFRIAEQIRLNRGENLDSIGFGKFMNPPGKHQRFNEYHSVIVTQSGRVRFLGNRPGAPFLAPGEQLGIVPPCPTLARRAASGAPSPLLVTRGAKLKAMMPARCPVSPLLNIQRFRKRSASMLSAEVAGGAADGSFDAISTRAGRISQDNPNCPECPILECCSPPCAADRI